MAEKKKDGAAAGGGGREGRSRAPRYEPEPGGWFERTYGTRESGENPEVWAEMDAMEVRQAHFRTLGNTSGGFDGEVGSISDDDPDMDAFLGLNADEQHTLGSLQDWVSESRDQGYDDDDISYEVDDVPIAIGGSFGDGYLSNVAEGITRAKGWEMGEYGPPSKATEIAYRWIMGD